MKRKIYIARDGHDNEKYKGDLFIYTEKPCKNSMDGVPYFFGKQSFPLDRGFAPEIQNGECFSAEIELKEKV